MCLCVDSSDSVEQTSGQTSPIRCQQFGPLQVGKFCCIVYRGVDLSRVELLSAELLKHPVFD